MRWRLRAVFVGLILVTGAWKLAVATRPVMPDDIPRDISRALAGRAAGPVTGQAWSPSISIFTAPVTGCAAPLLVVTAPPNFSATSIVLQMERPGDHPLFAYADWIAGQPDRMSVMRLQVWRKILSMAGVLRAANSDKLLFIAEPGGCAVAETAPWSRFWSPG